MLYKFGTALSGRAGTEARAAVSFWIRAQTCSLRLAPENFKTNPKRGHLERIPRCLPKSLITFPKDDSVKAGPNGDVATTQNR